MRLRVLYLYLNEVLITATPEIWGKRTNSTDRGRLSKSEAPHDRY